jgi:hypothetical protein
VSTNVDANALIEKLKKNTKQIKVEDQQHPYKVDAHERLLVSTFKVDAVDGLLASTIVDTNALTE